VALTGRIRNSFRPNTYEDDFAPAPDSALLLRTLWSSTAKVQLEAVTGHVATTRRRTVYLTEKALT